jgi:hypothetical protein
MLVDPTCPGGLALSRTPPNQILTCLAGGGATPVCSPTANPAAPTAGQSTTISANCSNQPNANGYVWSGGNCATVTGSSCLTTQRRPGTVTFTVKASNAAGQGAPGQLSVTWH